MDTSADTLDQADEEILTYTVSDEALEAAAGIEIEAPTYVLPCPWRTYGGCSLIAGC
jgi:hypothetical protein